MSEGWKPWPNTWGAVREWWRTPEPTILPKFESSSTYREWRLSNQGRFSYAKVLPFVSYLAAKALKDQSYKGFY